jgi:hypothetical protein
MMFVFLDSDADKTSSFQNSAEILLLVIYQWNFSEIEVYFLPPLPLRRRGIIPLLRRG